MKKSWDFIPKILSREKVIESRWYSSRRIPWNIITKGDVVFFKNTGESITVSAEVEKVIQYENLTPKKVSELLKAYGKGIGISVKETPFFYEIFKNKKYCILIFIKKPITVKHFNIDKTGFGSMSAWISVPKISTIKK